MKKQLGYLALVGALAVGVHVTPAFAGYKSNQPVTWSSNRFRGNLSYVRSTSDDIQTIGCQSGPNYVTCFARRQVNEWIQCSSSDPDVMAAVQGLTAYSHLDVTIGQPGVCTHVWVSTASSWAYGVGTESSGIEGALP